jgi:motility quorum-sensing regulator / GCU-specific mRNA interferase toxin
VEKRKPHYRLADIKAAFADVSRLNRTVSSKEGADELGLTDDQVVAVIQCLTRNDFDKSMTAHHDSKLWQDVYKTKTQHGTRLYVKFTTDAAGVLLLISFKKAEDR